MQQLKTAGRVRIFFVFFVITVLCQACGKNTLISSWTDNSFNGPVTGTILIIGVFRDPIAHKIYEDSFVDALEKTGIKATPSHRYGLRTTQPNHKELLQIVNKSGATAILTTHLLSEKTDSEEFLTEHYQVATVMYWDSFHNYHTVVYDRVWGGDEVKRKIDLMEASLFDAKSGKQIWSARSKSINLEDLLRKDDRKLENLFIKDLQRHMLL